jgi:exonuclease VII small subunit
MDELGQLESTIESRELDDLDQLMDEVSRAEKIIDELRSRLEAAEKKIEDSKSDDE